MPRSGAGPVAGWSGSAAGSGGSPSGPAGGDLAGTFPNPDVAGFHETGGPTALVYGAVPDLTLMFRSGTDVIGILPSDLTSKATPTLSDIIAISDAAASNAIKKITIGAIPAFVGDSGAGGAVGFVPAPAAGDAAAGKFLKADGTWEAPAGATSPFEAAAGVITKVTAGDILRLQASTADEVQFEVHRGTDTTPAAFVAGFYTAAGALRIGIGPNLNLFGGSGQQLLWSSNADPSAAAADTGIGRVSAALAFISDGSTGVGRLRVYGAASGTPAWSVHDGTNLRGACYYDSGSSTLVFLGGSSGQEIFGLNGGNNRFSVGGNKTIGWTAANGVTTSNTQVLWLAKNSAVNNLLVVGGDGTTDLYNGLGAILAGQYVVVITDNLTLTNSAGIGGNAHYVFGDAGAAEKTLTLATAIKGISHRVTNANATYALKIQAATGDVFLLPDGTVSASAGYIKLVNRGASVDLVPYDATTWLVRGAGGTITVDS